MNLNDFRVRAVQKSIRKKKRKNNEKRSRKSDIKNIENHQKSDPKWSQKPLKNHPKIDRKFDTKKGPPQGVRNCTCRRPGGSTIQQDSSRGNRHK